MRNDSGYNPLGKDTIDKMTAKKAEHERQILLLKEEEEQFIISVNRLFSSEDGKLFLNKLKRVCGLNLFDKDINPAKLIEDAGRRKVWFELIRPYVNKSILAELEQ